jgi:hypothetical protein
MFPYTLLTPEHADHRSRDAQRALEHHRLLGLAREGRPARRSIVRRPAAQAVAILSLGAASLVRRLDDCVADDLRRTLAPTE